ncbi:MlaD family protein [Aestuariibaculum suncheonense]|uniref:MCE family protein n=1 Tax=Aestuariibaculum suncheonense TaxID=1028745 RepID=A0A8J6Q5L5_9FLAO|nr:MlaD family protein [Aestuariibaculum suncheonense]MBD0835358.1 MCE family protein [Aestuariibaculum suncheonense]
MKISREVKTGVLVVLGIVLFIFGFNYLKGHNLLDVEDVYYTDFDYNALTKSSIVTVKGNTVGKVQDISYDFETGKTHVAFTVNPNLKFSKNSTIRMYETGLMGGNGLAILVSEEGEQAKPGDKLKSEVEMGLVTSLSKNFSGLSMDLNSTLKSADSLIVSLNKVVNDQSEQGLRHTVAQLNETLKAFEATSLHINGYLVNNKKTIEETLVNFKSTSEDLSVMMSDLKEADMGTTIASLNKTLESLQSVLASVDQGEGTLGKLLKDEGLYNNIEGATKEMEELLRDIKLHPKRYFRILSKKEIPYTNEEETN